MEISHKEKRVQYQKAEDTFPHWNFFVVEHSARARSVALVSAKRGGAYLPNQLRHKLPHNLALFRPAAVTNSTTSGYVKGYVHLLLEGLC